uniref:Putative polyprotein n=2 Tax=Oryza sativa subsp. japonica TaxID=39947 RepID=Q6UUP0_ORYSJ|nr:putative polyprotein [Oryza sativa Japonica Group]
MAAEEGAEPSASVAEDGEGQAPSQPPSAPAPSQPSSAPATSVQVPNTADVAKAAATARALQTRAENLSTNQLVVPQAAPSQPAAPTAPAVVQAQISLDPEAQAEADMEAMRQNMTRLQDMLRQMQEQQQAYEATRRTKATSAAILQYSAGYAPPQVRPQVVTQPSPPLAAQPPVYFAGQHQPPGQATQTVAEGASALQAQLQAFLQQLNQPHYISSTTPSAHPVGDTSQGAPNWLPPIQPGSGPSPWSQGQQFDFGNTAQPIFDPSMAAQQVPPVGAGQSNAAAQLHAQAAISPFATPYPQQANSIYSWEQLRDVFVLNFRGTYKEPKTQQHLLGIRQRPGESIREYMRRFSQARCQVQDITEASVINAASAGLLEGELTRKITNKEPQTLEHLLRIIDGFARGEEDSKRRSSTSSNCRSTSPLCSPVSAGDPGTAAKETEPHERPKHTPKPTPHGKITKVQMDDADPTKLVSLGGDMGEEEVESIQEVLKKNIDIFAWSPNEVGGVPADLIMHHLAVKPNIKPRKQKLRKMSADRQEAAKTEVQKLLWAGVIQEIDQPEWLANPVLVRKSNGKWRMCVDFTDLNKIHMNPLDIPKTSFITPFGTFCHLRMPFGLRNAGATFARLVYKVLGKQLGRKVEAYVDDIVVKSRKAFDHAFDLQETFDSLRAAGIKQNPEKCVFSVRVGKLLDFLVSERGIEANPEKINAIQQMKPPSSVHEVQKLTGRIAALSRFLSKAAERGLPFFKTLRGAGKFNWTPECKAAFDELKQYLQSPPALISPSPGSELLLYLVASPVAVSAALVQETESGQKPVYFVSEALQGAKTRYIEMKKLAYALVMASRKLKHYFQAHKVIVPSQYPLGEILRGKEVTGRLSKWAAELSPFDLHFVARSAIKSQVLADFVAEWTLVLAPDPEPNDQFWVMCSDGSWSHKGAGVAAVLFSPNGVPIWYAARLQFDTTNNAAEYEAVLTDSKLVVGHVDKSFEAKEEGMKRYLEAVRSMEKSFTGITVEHLPRDQNVEADALAKSAACGGPHSPGIFFEVLHAPSVPMDSSEVMTIDQEKLGEDLYDWRTPFVKHLETGWLLVDEAEAKRLQLRATKYRMVSGQLYRSGVLQPLLRCISFAEGEEMAKEIHQGLCGAHQAARRVASKVFRQGVYWPTVLKLWNISLDGSKSNPLGAITSAAVQKFVWKNIVCRFGVPKEFITDNGKQFDSDKFREMCEGLNLEIRFASVAHPQSNGAAERTNSKILEALKKRLEGAAKGKWPEELLSVLWALRTTPTRPTKFSPFMLLYGDEAMTPAELGANSPRVMFSGGKEGREVSLELLEGVRVEALEHLHKYATSTSATYNKKVRPTELMPGHLVLRKKANPVAVGKLESKWEGPYTSSNTSPGWDLFA